MAFLPSFLLISFGWFLWDASTLLVAVVLSSTSLFMAILQKEYRWLKGWGQGLLFTLFVVFFVSALASGERLAGLFQGNYQRNFGLSFWLSIALVFAFTASGKVKARDFIEKSIGFCILFSIIYGGLQRFKLDPVRWYNPYDAVQLTLGNPNFAGAFVGMIGVVPFAYAVANGIFWKRSVGLIGFVGIGYMALATKSLQAIVILILGVIVYLVVVSMKSDSRVSKAFRYLSGLIGVGLVAFTSILLISTTSRLAAIRDKFVSEGSINQRLDFWRTGIKIFMDHPFLGVGPDQFQRYAALYRTKDQIIRSGDFSIPDKAHSVPIDALANGGIFAGAIWIVFVLIIFAKLIQTARSELDSLSRNELAILGAIWSGYIFQALISPDQIVLAITGFMAAGLIISINRIQNKPVEKKSKLNPLFAEPFYFRTFFISIFVISSVIWVQTIQTDILVKRVLNNEKVTKEKILAAVSGWPAPKTTEAIAVEVSKVDEKCIITDLLADRLLKIDDRSSMGWYLKTICYNRNQEFDLALAASKKALLLDPLNPSYLVARVKMGIAAGEKNEATIALKALKENYPDNSKIEALETSISQMN